MSQSRIYQLLSRWWLGTFVLLGVSFVLFGFASLNLIHLLGANLEFRARHGWDAARDGGVMQLVELVFTGYTAAACYIVFKLCEKVLVERLASVKKKEIES